jgi:type I restriction enzyme S subunit
MKYPKDWKQTKLKNCSLISGEYGINAAGVPFSENLPKYLRITDIDDSSNVLRLNNMVSVDNTESHKFLLADKDIVFARTGASVGKTYLHNQEKYGGLVFAGFLIRFRLDSKILLPEFLYQFCETNEYWNWVKMTSQRSGQPGINSQEFGQLTFPLPPLPEQQKIATILSKWDETIDAQSQLIEAKEKLKQGLMQKLLSGEVRFPGFEEDWEMKKLGDIGKIKMCKRIFNHQTLSEGDIPFYKIGTFGKKADAFISNELYEEYKNKFSFPLKGEILISAAGTLGRTVVYDGKPAFFQDSNIVWLSHDETIVLNRFLYFVYQTVRYESEGGTIQRLYNSIIYDVDIYLPSIEEQNKIATFLTYTDEEIRNLKTELEALKLQKKGLMQELLTGKIRVKA